MTKPKVYRSLAEIPNPKYVPVEEVMKNYAAEAAAADALIRKRGRPKKGTVVEAGRVHAIRIPDSLWLAVKEKAKALGLTTSAAVQLALRTWTAKGGRT